MGLFNKITVDAGSNAYSPEPSANDKMDSYRSTLTSRHSSPSILSQLMGRGECFGDGSVLDEPFTLNRNRISYL